MQRGFTLIEVMVVVAVLIIISTLSVFGFNQYRIRASDGQGRTLAATLKAGAERYYGTNNEYPSAQILFTSGGATAPSCTTAPSYTNSATKLNVGASTLDGSPNKLQPYAGANCTWEQNKVYYLTKTTTDANATRAYTFAGCTYTLADTTNGDAGASALIAYYSRQNSLWHVMKSDKGIVTTSDGFWCPFRSP